jgi:phage terminase large subunit
MPSLKINTPRWGIDFLKPARYKAAHGGRGSGKSHLFAEMVIEALIINPDCRVVCVREVQKSIKQSVKLLLETKIESLGVGHLFEVQQTCIKSKLGNGEILFSGLMDHTADSIKSMEGIDICWCEEASSISQRSLDLLRPTIRKNNSELWFTFNPRSPDDPIDKLLRGKTPPKDAIVKQVNFTDNPWMPQVLLDEMEYDRKRDPDKYNHVWLGEYLKNTEATVFKNWHVEEFETPDDAEFRLGMDFGFAADPAVVIRCFIKGRKLYIDYEAYAIGCETVDLPDLILTIPESERWAIVADSSRPETISHLRKHGFPKIMPSVKGAGSIEDGIEFLKSYDIFVHPRCQHVERELLHYKYKEDSLTGKILPVFADKDNHLIDALRYALEAVRRAPVQQATQVKTIKTTKRW